MTPTERKEPTPAELRELAEWSRAIADTLLTNVTGKHFERIAEVLEAQAARLAAEPAAGVIEALKAAEPYLETLHSMTPLGPSRRSVFRIIEQVRAALSKHRSGE